MNKKQYIKIPDKEELQEAVEAIKSKTGDKKPEFSATCH